MKIMRPWWQEAKNDFKNKKHSTSNIIPIAKKLTQIGFQDFY